MAGFYNSIRILIGRTSKQLPLLLTFNDFQLNIRQKNIGWFHRSKFQSIVFNKQKGVQHFKSKLCSLQWTFGSQKMPLNVILLDFQTDFSKFDNYLSFIKAPIKTFESKRSIFIEFTQFCSK